MKYLAAILFLLACFASAQARAGNGVLKGVVTDELGAVIARASIVATDVFGETWQALSNDDGEYKLELPEGKYTIVFSSHGFVLIKVLNYRPDGERIINLKMKVNPDAGGSFVCGPEKDDSGQLICRMVCRQGKGTTEPEILDLESPEPGSITTDPITSSVSSGVTTKPIQSLPALRGTDPRTWLRGILRDNYGAVYPNTDILFTGRNGKFKTRTDENGKYQILLLPERYDITVDGTGKGFKTFKIRSYLIPAHSEMTLDMALESPPTDIL
ncbi:MAG TPA: carboxypeptidase-like regulatory domain-containing protein [Pyrinomonadaceae bacterium]|jgi:hypothetical protein|nr:carboxypeptidase-like regulatory domain-containing protein [Pyrinomonadaceae bacterium]